MTEARAIAALVPTAAWQTRLDADGDVLGSSQSARVRRRTKPAETKVLPLIAWTVSSGTVAGTSRTIRGLCVVNVATEGR